MSSGSPQRIIVRMVLPRDTSTYSQGRGLNHPPCVTPSAPRLHGSFSRGHHSSSTCDSPPNRSPPHKASSSSDQPLRSPDIASRQRSPFPPTQSTHAVSSKGSLLAQHDHRMRRIEEALDRNSQQLSQVTDTLRIQCSMSASSAEPAPPPQPPTAPAVRESYVPPPEPFSGDLDKCRGFLLQCHLVFAQQPQTYASDAAKVAYVVRLLRGRALEWAEAKLGSSFLIPFHTFVEELRKIFDHPARSKNAADRLLSLRQGFRSVVDFSVEFRVLATEAQWDDAALRTVFRHGLSDPVKDELTHRDPPDSLDELIEQHLFPRACALPPLRVSFLRYPVLQPLLDPCGTHGTGSCTSFAHGATTPASGW
ncbi:hypothetical protein Q8A73_006399 [Channa argus]|nr:hypothetical protein Q8A73_006399 [Channa argus]